LASSFHARVRPRSRPGIPTQIRDLALPAPARFDQFAARADPALHPPHAPAPSPLSLFRSPKFPQGNSSPPPLPVKLSTPRLAAAEYEGYFFSHNATASLTPNAGRLRPLAFFFHMTSLGGDGTGGDAFIVETLEVDRLTTP
jgi:hypothetical protein